MFAKSIFRSASIKALSTKTTPMKNLSKMMLLSRCSMSATQFQTRHFSASLQKGRQRLSKALEKEIKYENENYS